MADEMAGPEACVLVSDADLNREIQHYLGQQCGFRTVAMEFAAAFDPGPLGAPMLVVVSALPDAAGGLDLIRALRAAGMESFLLYIDTQSIPDEGGDAFAAGADDVIRAPFTMREFGLRLRARLGAECVCGSDGRRRSVPQVILDAQHRLLAAGCDKAVQLTRAEAQVMAVLVRSGGEIVTRNDLSQAIDQTEWQYGDRRFDVHVASIRKKLGKVFGTRFELRSVRGQGYAFREAAEAEERGEGIASRASASALRH